MRVIKRDGTVVSFDKDKIISAILNAFTDVDGEVTQYAKDKANNIANYISNLNKDLTVEEIQDTVEQKLMQCQRKDVAKSYIIYRNERTKAREWKSELIKNVSEKINAKNVQNQNANVDENSFGGRIGEASGTMLKDYALKYCMSSMAKNNHLNNEIYTHDLDHYAIGDHNCFQRNTKFITDSGIKSFEDFRDGDVIKVLTKDGTWNEATVRRYGRKPMKHVTLQRCGKTKEINCTSNHRWFLSDGSITENLSVGDTLITLTDITDNFRVKSVRDAEIFCLGFILGDGCDHIIHNNLTIQAVLCGDKKKYSDIFEKAYYHLQKSSRKEDLLYSKKTTIGKQDFLTNKMWNMLSFNDKIALFNGYLAADGSKTTNTKIVWTSDCRILEMIKDISALSGYHIFNIKEIETPTNYKENRILYEITFTTKYSNNSAWKVINIKNQPNEDYEAWCIEEPVTHSFTLDGGVVTGNCLTVPFDDLLANGFNTRQVDIRPANSINTALQLVAVIFQLQSLMQFGGVSASHLDWTLVPYVRKSFYKHFKDGLRYFNDDYVDDNYLSKLDKKYKGNEPSIESEEYKFDEKLYRYAMDMTERELKQAVEALFHNLNSLQSRSGNQLPFSSINYGTCTSTEGRMIIRALINGSIRGVGKFHSTSIFPCCIFQCMKGVNREPGDPNYDLFRLALKSTAQRLYPNYANCNWSGNAGYDINDPKTIFSTMG